MSTATEPLWTKNTANINIDNDERNVFYYGKKGTVIESKDRDIRPRAQIKREPEKSLTDPIENIRQRFNGVVTAIAGDEINTRLDDVTNPNNPVEEMILSIEDIAITDRSLIRIGAMFTIYIGYREGPKYSRERFTRVSFRRLPVWTEEEINEADTLAKEYADLFADSAD